MPRIAPMLWFDGKAKEAADFYCSIFPNSTILETNPLVTYFQLDGFKVSALNGGPQFRFTEATSFVIECRDQQEIDFYWSRLLAGGGQESMCGWLKDKYGFSWQVTPANIGRLLARPGAMEAMLKMHKLDIAKLENP